MQQTCLRFKVLIGPGPGTIRIHRAKTFTKCFIFLHYSNVDSVGAWHHLLVALHLMVDLITNESYYKKLVLCQLVSHSPLENVHTLLYNRYSVSFKYKY